MSINNTKNLSLCPFLSKNPTAVALIAGSGNYPEILGTVYFYKSEYGIIVFARINRLPTETSECSERFFAFHIHDGNKCIPRFNDAFSAAKSHYNPKNCEHPNHSGDLPVLISTSNGYALSVFLTDRFTIEEIIGKTIIIHRNTDDFKTQPSGKAGEKIACGVIKKL